MRFTDVAAVTGGTLLDNETGDMIFRGISIDSRQVKPGELFIAIRGENQDGHAYIDQALQRGAAGVLAEASYTRGEGTGQAAVVTVANSHEAMIELAKNYRSSLRGKFIGITGSNGKTTTKELCYRLLKAVEPDTYCSPGNLNNLYGVPLALFAVDSEAKVVVLEMGISTRNEMPRLADIVRPEVILITNVGPSHLEFLDTVEEVARCKLELVRRAAPSVPLIVNADDALLVRETKKVRGDFFTFALNSSADFTVDDLQVADDGTTMVRIENHVFRLPLVGRHQVYNLLAAYAVFRTIGYDFEGIETRDMKLGTAPMRGQRMEMEGIVFVADCYNANPESVRAGLEAYFATKTGGRRVLILGDMLELGETSEQYHRRVGQMLAARSFDKAMLVGEQSKYIMDEAIKAGAKPEFFDHFDQAEHAARSAKEFLREGDFVYIKGSRGIGLEAVLNVFGETEEQK
ncbi:MAG: UDP-N-acetylmuramoyl-tripeptide--D-alanyl-D-alanine ligase [Candidatus Zixiibacteriota bacterium]|nr:MAG: UDP-N-acetylmuramoyl-tripeptide--D-alanyl-D-alanine ligase [candidate division Zixibacteria bacterium]